MEQDFITQTAIDQMVSTDQDQMMKAMIPYLPPRGQQVLSVYTKARELTNTLALFSSAGKSVQMCAAAAPAAEPLEMINDIRRFCYGQSRQKLDQMVNMLAMVQMLQLMKEEPSEKKG